MYILCKCTFYFFKSKLKVQSNQLPNKNILRKYSKIDVANKINFNYFLAIRDIIIN